jgi:hypothetical protein
MNEHVNPFAHITENPPVFTTKPRMEKRVEEAHIAQLAVQHNFPSWQAARPPGAERRKPRTYRTGRNVHFNTKIRAETSNRVYKQAMR